MKNKYILNIVPKTFFEEESNKVAPKLLGKYLIRKLDTTILIGKIIEVEAYLSSNDKAAHNTKGKTAKTKSLFNDAGSAYIHSMRHHFLLDVVTEGIGIPGSVLIRGLEPIEGIEIMSELRKTNDVFNLTNGPGKICQAFRIDKNLDGIDLTSPESPLLICSFEQYNNMTEIENTSRIGITKDADLLLRYYLKGNPYVSNKKTLKNPT